MDHITVERYRTLAEGLEVDDGAQGSTDQALDLVGAAAACEAASGGALRAGAGQHAVLGGDPAALSAGEEARHLVEDGRGADDDGVSGLDEAGALGVLAVAGAHGDRAELVVLSSVGPWHGTGLRGGGMSAARGQDWTCLATRLMLRRA